MESFPNSSLDSGGVNSSLNESVYEALNERKYVGGIFVDLRKAYDTIDHRIILEKLNAYEIRGVVLSWFRSYFTGRKHRVRIRSAYRNVK